MIAEQRRRRSRRRPRPRPPVRLLDWRLAVAAVVIVLVILGGGFLWLRSSSLVAVRQVRVTGLSGPGAGPIRSALTSEARTMTTLDLDVGALLRSVSSYRYVRSLRVSTHFPHGVTIDVHEDVPLATISLGGRTVTVTGTGELVPRGVRPSGPLPSVPLGSPGSRAGGQAGGAGDPAGGAERITAPGALAALHVLAAAPYRFLPHIKSAKRTAAHGVVVQLRDGPWVYFGARDKAAAKWTAVLALLAARGSNSVAGAQYLDVSDPRSPSVGAHISGSH